MPEKDPATGKFVKTASELAAEEAEAVPEEPAKKPPLRLQSRYQNHRIMIRPTRVIIHEKLGIAEPVPGLVVRFEGPQRIFDSEVSQKFYGWSDEERDAIERKLVQLDEFMKDFYPAPMCPLPPHLLEIARVRPPERRMKCQAFGVTDGELNQCPKPAEAGRMWCAEHDPDVTRIVRGGGTTVG